MGQRLGQRMEKLVQRERERIMENGKDESKVTKMNFAAKAKHFKWKSFSCAREGIRERS